MQAKRQAARAFRPEASDQDLAECLSGPPEHALMSSVWATGVSLGCAPRRLNP